MNVTVEGVDGRCFRARLIADMSIYKSGNSNGDNVGTGITLHEIWFQPRAKRVIAKYYSIWANRLGECCGQFFRELQVDEILRHEDIPDEIKDIIFPPEE